MSEIISRFIIIFLSFFHPLAPINKGELKYILQPFYPHQKSQLVFLHSSLFTLENNRVLDLHICLDKICTVLFMNWNEWTEMDESIFNPQKNCNSDAIIKIHSWIFLFFILIICVLQSWSLSSNSLKFIYQLQFNIVNSYLYVYKTGFK